MEIISYRISYGKNGTHRFLVHGIPWVSHIALFHILQGIFISFILLHYPTRDPARKELLLITAGGHRLHYHLLASAWLLNYFKTSEH